MLRSLLATALAVATFTASSPAAVAAHDGASCRFSSFGDDTVTGPNHWAGITYGYATGAPGETVKVECVIRVDGSVATSSGIGEGSGAAVVVSPIEFDAAPYSSVQLCTRAFTTAHGWREDCYTGWMPEWIGDLRWRLQELAAYLEDYAVDLANELVILYVDPALSDALDDHPGTYGPVTINADGDVFVNGEWYWDCPPYDLSGA